MNPLEPFPVPDWRWATPEGNRELDRLLDRRLTFREILEWLEEAETLSLRLQAQREKRIAQAAAKNETDPLTGPDFFAKK